MSSQDNKGIPFSYAANGIGYKLLELPPELAELLEGANPPTYANTLCLPFSEDDLLNAARDCAAGSN